MEASEEEKAKEEFESEKQKNEDNVNDVEIVNPEVDVKDEIVEH